MHHVRCDKAYINAILLDGYFPSTYGKIWGLAGEKNLTRHLDKTPRYSVWVMLVTLTPMSTHALNVVRVCLWIDGVLGQLAN